MSPKYRESSYVHNTRQATATAAAGTGDEAKAFVKTEPKSDKSDKKKKMKKRENDSGSSSSTEVRKVKKVKKIAEISNVAPKSILKQPKTKRPLSSYNYYFKEKLSNIQKQEVEIPVAQKTPFSEFPRVIGKMWRETKPEERIKYKEQHENDIVRYNREVSEKQIQVTRFNQLSVKHESMKDETNSDKSE